MILTIIISNFIQCIVECPNVIGRTLTLSCYINFDIPSQGIILAACMRVKFPTLPPSLGEGLFICYLPINWSHSLWFGKVCVTTSPKLWHCLCLAILYPCLYLVRSTFCCAGEIRKALPIILFYSQVSEGISEAFSLCTYHGVASNLPQGCVPLNYAILLFAYLLLLRYLVALHSYS